ncbi:MAG: hypothetical protein JOZ11_11360 [Alphaproteobacteria bacterium]|nr:hypothetical protein [Alphaproteobacteria bacterium]
MKLTMTYLAGALSFACLPALAVELPDYGSKNFSPSGDTPSYFANEATPVSARTADTTQGDWSAVDEIAPARPAFESTRSAHGHRGRHGRYGVVQTSSRHGAGRYGGKAVGTTSTRHGKPGGRHANSGVAHYIVN